MDRRQVVFTAMIIGGTVGLAPVSSWSQDAPKTTRPSSPEQSRPGAMDNVPETSSSATQELSKNDMKLVQQRLQEKGYRPGNVEGTTDDTTRAAIRKFQQDERIPVTGTIDELTANRLGFKYAKNPTDRRGTASDRRAPNEQPSRR